MTIVHLYPPVAAAGIVLFFWFLQAYRFHKKELATAKESVPQTLWYMLPLATAGFYIWYVGDEPRTSYVHIFFATFVGLGMAAIFVFGIYKSLYDRSLRFGLRLWFGLCAVFLLTIIGWSAFAG
jgi:hypothetical protein